MPLRCTDESGSSIQAFELDASGWDELVAANRASQGLRMPCCDTGAIPKRSQRGTQFFAHKAKQGCSTGDETREHLELKKMAVDAAKANGWTVRTEYADPDGLWRADVCIKPVS